MPDETLTADYYSALGVDRNATDLEIRSAYIKLVKLSHPDRLGTSPDPSAWKSANDQLARFNEAFFVLGDPVRRKQYDDGHGPETAAPPKEEQPPRNGCS